MAHNFTCPGQNLIWVYTNGASSIQAISHIERPVRSTILCLGCARLVGGAFKLHTPMYLCRMQKTTNQRPLCYYSNLYTCHVDVLLFWRTELLPWHPRTWLRGQGHTFDYHEQAISCILASNSDALHYMSSRERSKLSKVSNV